MDDVLSELCPNSSSHLPHLIGLWPVPWQEVRPNQSLPRDVGPSLGLTLESRGGGGGGGATLGCFSCQPADLSFDSHFVGSCSGIQPCVLNQISGCLIIGPKEPRRQVIPAWTGHLPAGQDLHVFILLFVKFLGAPMNSAWLCQHMQIATTKSVSHMH